MLLLSDVVFRISDRFVLQPENIRIETGQHIAVIGESGCGKTTLLKLIYGLYDLDQGSIQWKDDIVSGPKDNLIPGMPYMKYLSQDFDLMPFTSVAENINKYLSRLEPETSAKRTVELLEVVEMSAFAKAHVKTLSGGQKQRVALAQTLAKEPELLLLDEPFSHIDNFRKNKLRRKLFAYLKRQNITCIVATHDATDVLAYMDETLVMRDGEIIANAPTETLYNNPPSYYVASLFGDVNEVPKKWFDAAADEGEKMLVYPGELKVHTKGIKISITAQYFMGNYYVLKGKHLTSNTPILLHHNHKTDIGIELFIDLIRSAY